MTNVRIAAGALATLWVAGLVTALAVPGSQLLALVTAGITLPAITLGALLAWRRPSLVTAAHLVALGVAPVFVFTLSQWGSTDQTQDPLPFARLAAAVAAGSWIWFYVPPALLALTFPDGRPPGPRWRPVVWLLVGDAVVIHVLIAIAPTTYTDFGGSVRGSPPLALAPILVNGVGVLALVVFIGLLVLAAWSVVARQRRATTIVRKQIKWFALSAALVPAVLMVCFVIVFAFGGANEIVLAGLAVVFVSMPLTVAVAILRHDLYDIDRLVSRAVAATALTGAVALLFAGVAVVVGTAVGRDSVIGAATATFVCTVAVIPLWRIVRERTDRHLYVDRTRALAIIRNFASDVRSGRAAPEGIEETLRAALGDPDVSVSFESDESDPGLSTGGPLHRETSEGPTRVIIAPAGRTATAVTLGHAWDHRPALVRELLLEAQPTIEIAALRNGLRRALSETEASRARLVKAGDVERRRLEHDLHDGAQQRLVALALSLRLAERRLGPADPNRIVLLEAVEQLRDAVEDLRSVAHGLRPRGLDDGLPTALHQLIRTVPIPVELAVDKQPVPDWVATTLYYVAAEAVTNALKHAQPRGLRLHVDRTPGFVTLTVADDGAGGANPAWGRGLAGIADRVEAVGGKLTVTSLNGEGTTIQAVLPCES